MNRSAPFALVLLLGSLVVAIVRQGAYHEWHHQMFASLTLAAGVMLLGAKMDRRALLTGALIIGPLVASSLVSMALSADRSDAGSTLLEIVLVGIGLSAGMSIPKQQRELVVNVLILIAVIVGFTAVWGVATHTTPWGRITEGVWRGSSSLTYANAAASVVGPIGLLTLIHAARTGGRTYAIITCALIVALLSTQSRGGMLAFLIVGVAVVGMLGLRQFSATILPIATGVVIGAPVLLVLASDARPARSVLSFGAILVGLTATGALWAVRERIPRPTGVLVVIVSVTLVGSIATGLSGPLTERLTLRSGTTALGEEADVRFGDRAKEWSAAWDQFTDEPVFGHGPGVVTLRWTEDGRDFRAIFVHNEYLELAVTNGVVGLGALALAAWTVLRRRDIDESNQAAAVAVVAFLLHSSVDYLWHLPALPVLFAIAAGMIVRALPAQPIRERRHTVALEEVGK